MTDQDNETDPVLLLLKKIRQQIDDVTQMIRDEKESPRDRKTGR